MKKFIRTIGKYPQEMIADRDFRLIGQAIHNFLNRIRKSRVHRAADNIKTASVNVTGAIYATLPGTTWPTNFCLLSSGTLQSRTQFRSATIYLLKPTWPASLPHFSKRKAKKQTTENYSRSSVLPT